MEMPLVSMGGRVVKSEPTTFEVNDDGGDGKSNSAWDDLSFSSMTLKELQERCKMKKRKLSKSSSLTKQEIKTCSHTDGISNKQKHASVQPKKDESDLEEPLSSWKLKLSKKSKAKRNCIAKRVRLYSEPAVPVEAVTEQIPGSQDSLQNTGDIHGSINVKIEILEPDSSSGQNVVCVADGSISDAHASTAEIFGEITKVGFSGMTSYKSLPSFVSEHMKEGDITHPLPCYSPEEVIPVTNDLGFEIYVSCESCSFPPEKISCQMNSNTVTQMPDTATNYGADGCVSEMEVEDDSKDDTPANLETNVISNPDSLYILSQNSYLCFNPHNGSDSVDDGLPTTMEKHSFLAINGPVSGVLGAVNCSLGTRSSDATDGLTDMELLRNYHVEKLECPPKRLFSTRKAISPTSQEKLRQAVDAKELYGNIEGSGCKERLFFEKQTKNKDSSAASGLERGTVSISPDRIIKKLKNGSLPLIPKGILKAPHVSCVTPRAGTKCTSVQTRPHKAVAFTQRQMHDFDCLAMKLMKELKSMKDIMEETLSSEACLSTPSKYTAAEMRMAIENAAEVEETTRKWLSMMARDCNRFCKIMRTTEKKAVVASGYGMHKERKKITFADEAGGML